MTAVKNYCYWTFKKKKERDVCKCIIYASSYHRLLYFLPKICLHFSVMSLI